MSKFKSYRFMDALFDMITYENIDYLAFVRSTGEGQKQVSEYPVFKWEWVHGKIHQGLNDNMVTGEIYVQIKENRFLKMSYHQ